MSANETPPESRNWPKDEFGRSEALSQAWIVWSVLIISAIAIVATIVVKQSSGGATLVAYCAQDQVYAEPILREFQSATGIKVRAVYDSEAVKTVGLANRLLAERERPRCDVFWGNEELRTRQLSGRGVFRETNGWAAFGFRTRRIVINTNLVSPASAPGSLLDLTNAHWRGKVALAYPQFGTTATHFHALRQVWGEEPWLAWCRALAANEPRVVDGNSVVVRLVGKGEAAVGLTDSDDIVAGQREGLPVAALPIGPETLLIPNTVAVINRAPHPEAAQRLFDFLRAPPVTATLVKAGALEGEALDAARPGTLALTEDSWNRLLEDLEATTGQLGRIFLR